MRIEDFGRCGVSVPGLRFVDAANGMLGIEWVNGKTVRYLLGSRHEGEEGDEGEEVEAGADEDPLAEYATSKGTIPLDYLSGYKDFFSHETGQDALMEMVGTEIAKMHLADIVHGDLTTSNMMLRHPSPIGDPSQGTQQLVGKTFLAFPIDRY
jgi:TP53 regulating kinase-like protein